MKQRTIYLLLLVMVTIGFYYWENHLDKKHYSDFEKEINVNKSKAAFNFLPTSSTNQIIKHAYYTLSYSEKHEQAEWVAYHLKKEHIHHNNFKRPYFEIDPLVKTKAAHWKNYKRSGYDRGHLCPAADRRFNKKAFEETFLTSNISPQLNVFNAGIWNNLEKQVRMWVKKEKELYVVTGPIFDNTKKRIGFEQVTVPTHFYKIILSNTKKPKVIAFLIPHKSINKPLSNYVVSVDQLEKKLGIDFFNALSDTIENDLERNTTSKGWKFFNF